MTEAEVQGLAAAIGETVRDGATASALVEAINARRIGVKLYLCDDEASVPDERRVAVLRSKEVEGGC